MSIEEIMQEIQVVEKKLLKVTPGSIEHINLIIVLAELNRSYIYRLTNKEVA